MVIWCLDLIHVIMWTLQLESSKTGCVAVVSSTCTGVSSSQGLRHWGNPWRIIISFTTRVISTYYAPNHFNFCLHRANLMDAPCVTMLLITYASMVWDSSNFADLIDQLFQVWFVNWPSWGSDFFPGAKLRLGEAECLAVCSPWGCSST